MKRHFQRQIKTCVPPGLIISELQYFFPNYVAVYWFMIALYLSVMVKFFSLYCDRSQC